MHLADTGHLETKSADYLKKKLFATTKITKEVKHTIGRKLPNNVVLPHA